MFHQALIIVGHERRFSTDAKKLEAYLRDECGIHFIGRIDATHLAPAELHMRMAAAFGSCGVSPLLVAYSGHGWTDGWRYGTEDGDTSLKLKYRLLAPLLMARPGPTLMLNDCCKAGGLTLELERQLANPEKIGVISASTAYGWCENQLTKNVIVAWRKRQAFKPRRWKRPGAALVIQNRWGAELDRHYFPKKP